MSEDRIPIGRMTFDAALAFIGKKMAWVVINTGTDPKRVLSEAQFILETAFQKELDYWRTRQ